MNPFRFIETEYTMYKNAAKVRKQYNLQNFFALFFAFIYCTKANILSNSKCNLAAKSVEMFEETFFRCIKI